MQLLRGKTLDTKRTNLAAERNKDPIYQVLSPLLKNASVLELASGSGQHASYFCYKEPSLSWQPSDIDPVNIMSIDSWAKEYQLSNICKAIRLDTNDPKTWPIKSFDLIVNINMIHISPWQSTIGLFQLANKLINPKGHLFLYGPYLQKEIDIAPSNREFDQWLKSQNSGWGLRQLEDVIDLAKANGFLKKQVTSMPANNLSVIFSKI